MQTRSRMRAHSVLLGAAIAAAAAPAAAQTTDVDPRWQAFLGCWAPVAEEGMPVPDHIVCFRAEPDGVTALTLSDDVVQAEEVIIADGSSHAVAAESCAGTQTARWSEDGVRVYTRASMDCGTGLLGRESSGVLALSSPGVLIDVQTVGVGEEHGVRVIQYRALAPSEYPAAMRALAPAGDGAERLFAAAPLSLDDVIEASSALPAPAVQAMLVNLPASRVRIDAEALLRLADAGVDPETIDVVIALSYPEKFALAPAGPALVEEERTLEPGLWATAPYYDPWRDPWSRYDPYGYRYGSRYGGYYYSPFGYNPYGWGYGGGGVIIIDRDDDDDAGVGSGTVVKGRGYTRGSRSSSGTASGRSSTATAPAARTSRPSATRSTGSGSRTTSRAVPSRGSEGSSSAGTTTRKAKPRGGGGN